LLDRHDSWAVHGLLLASRVVPAPYRVYRNASHLAVGDMDPLGIGCIFTQHGASQSVYGRHLCCGGVLRADAGTLWYVGIMRASLNDTDCILLKQAFSVLEMWVQSHVISAECALICIYQCDFDHRHANCRVISLAVDARHLSYETFTLTL
jgi:hypothetical protein